MSADKSLALTCHKVDKSCYIGLISSPKLINTDLQKYTFMCSYSHMLINNYQVYVKAENACI